MRARRKDCIYRDWDGGACGEKQISAEDAAHEPANAEFCWEHRPVHIYDRDPDCWSWPLPSDPMNPDPWIALADWQDDRCGICGRDEIGSVLDHDHQTGLARGWICRTCNVQEGRTRRPRSRSARWRACPATAMLGFLLPYGQGWDATDGNVNTWTGKTYLPEHAPQPADWPHALTCHIPPIQKQSGLLQYQCAHPHMKMILDAIRKPMTDGEPLVAGGLPEDRPAS